MISTSPYHPPLWLRSPHLQSLLATNEIDVLQPDIAQRLRDRKASALEATRPDVIAAGNVGCMKQIGGGSSLPIVHTVELLDWRLGGEMPAALRGRKAPS